MDGRGSDHGRERTGAEDPTRDREMLATVTLFGKHAWPMPLQTSPSNGLQVMIATMKFSDMRAKYTRSTPYVCRVVQQAFTSVLACHRLALDPLPHPAKSEWINLTELDAHVTLAMSIAHESDSARCKPN